MKHFLLFPTGLVFSVEAVSASTRQARLKGEYA